MTVDWKARAEQEAAAIVREACPQTWTYDLLVTLVAIGWLQGANYADHQTLSDMEGAFDELRAAL